MSVPFGLFFVEFLKEIKESTIWVIFTVSVILLMFLVAFLIKGCDSEVITLKKQIQIEELKAKLYILTNKTVVSGGGDAIEATMSRKIGHTL